MLAAACGAPPAADGPLSMSPPVAQHSQDGLLFIAVHGVSPSVAWAAGTGGRYARTTDGGTNWIVGTVAGADSLQFRDVHGFSDTSALLLSIGTGSDSRIYRTDNGGESWTLQFQNDEPEAFFDCMDFWDGSAGIAFSDAVDGKFVIITTDDGGLTWSHVDPGALPDALPGEGSFAASGTCVTTYGDSTAWIGTGAGGKARVLKTDDRGKTWVVTETPIAGGDAAGIASISFRDPLNGFAAGGDLGTPEDFVASVAVTNDGGLTWELAGQTTLPGMIYGAAWVPGAPTPTIVATNPTGVSFSTDNGLTWQSADTLNFWGVDFVSPDVGWTVGTDGRITRRSFVR